MGIIKSLANKIVYSLTKKPEHYVHVDKPKNLQDLRQIQYNNWCKAKGVYNGSYLPEKPDTLLKKGWVDTTSPKNKTGYIRDFTRKSSGQKVQFNDGRFNDKSEWEEKHYHWENPNPDKTTGKTKDATKRLDRYGLPCGNEHRSHLAPLDKDYPKPRKRKAPPSY